MELCQHAGGFQSVYRYVILVCYGTLNLWHLQDFLSGLILFIFVLIASSHHFRWCERNAFNACRKKEALSGPRRTVRFPQASHVIY